MIPALRALGIGLIPWSPARSDRTEAAALRRIERAGAIVTSLADLLITAAPDLAAPPGKDVPMIVHRLMSMRIED